MSDYDNENKGVLFPNAKKTKAKQPGLRGQMNIGGVDYWASAWRKIGKESGQPYISIAMQEKDVEDAETINAELHPHQGGEKEPKFKGVIHMSEEQELPIAAWISTKSTDGTSFFSIKIEEASGGAGGNGDKIDEGDIFFGLGSSQEQAPSAGEPPMDFDDDIPFAPIGLQYGRNLLHVI